jgi:hypothetical protein
MSIRQSRSSSNSQHPETHEKSKSENEELRNDTEESWKESPDSGTSTDIESPPPQAEEQNNDKGSGQKDEYLVDWDGPDDNTNPRNWSTGYKSWITFQLGMLALAASLGSSIISPALPTVATYTGVSNEVAVLATALYM